MQGDGTARLSSPWDVAWWRDRVWVAMAGIHQLWTFDPRTGEVAVAAGTTNEGLLDGPAGEAWFAQTSGLAPDGERLWLADSETSSLRYVLAEPSVVEPRGHLLRPHRDRLRPVRLRLPRRTGRPGAAAAPAGRDGAARRQRRRVRHVQRGGAAPRPGERRGDDAGGRTSPSRAGLRRCGAPGGRRVRCPPADPAPARGGAGHRGLRAQHAAAGDRGVGFAATGRVVRAAAGQKVDDRFGPPSQLVVEATPAALIREGGGRGTDLTRTLTLDPRVGEGVLHIAARAASCDLDGGEGAACRMHQQDWGVPVRVSEAGDAHLVLPLGGSVTAPVAVSHVTAPSMKGRGPRALDSGTASGRPFVGRAALL